MVQQAVANARKQVLAEGWTDEVKPERRRGVKAGTSQSKCFASSGSSEYAAQEGNSHVPAVGAPQPCLTGIGPKSEKELNEMTKRLNRLEINIPLRLATRTDCVQPNSPNMPENSFCIACGTVAKRMYKCKICLEKFNVGSYYCSKACQEKDWKEFYAALEKNREVPFFIVDHCRTPEQIRAS